MESRSPVVALAIPLAGIAFAVFYILMTADYPDTESVKFPYTLATVTILCFALLLPQEAVRAWRRGWRPRLPSSVGGWLAERFEGKARNPLYVVLLTLLYTPLLPVLKTLLATFLFVVGLRCVFRNLKPRLVLYDAVAMIGIYIVFHDLLRIQLPSGPAEAFLSGLVRALLP